MFSATVICQDCGAPILIEAASENSLECSVRKKKYCAECAYKRHRKNQAKYQKTYKFKKTEDKRKKPVKQEDFSFEDFDKAYERFFAKRGIDIKKEVSFNDDPFPV